MFLEAASIALTLAMRSCEEKEGWFCGQQMGCTGSVTNGRGLSPTRWGNSGPQGAGARPATSPE